jgi:hypothetical protein
MSRRFAANCVACRAIACGGGSIRGSLLASIRGPALREVILRPPIAVMAVVVGIGGRRGG